MDTKARSIRASWALLAMGMLLMAAASGDAREWGSVRHLPPATHHSTHAAASTGHWADQPAAPWRLPPIGIPSIHRLPAGPTAARRLPRLPLALRRLMAEDGQVHNSHPSCRDADPFVRLPPQGPAEKVAVPVANMQTGSTADAWEMAPGAPQYSAAEPREPSSPAYQPASQTPALAAAVGQAERLVRHALSLARRRAYYSARADCIGALSLIAETLDAQAGGKHRSQCLASGMRALREAQDFATGGTALAAEVDLASVIAAHRTPVLYYDDLDRMTPLEAQQRYYDYAAEQLAEAAGGVPSASEALFGLGKLSLVMADPQAATILAHQCEATAIYRAALAADPCNYLAANELGVVLARQGRLDEARAALRQALDIYPLPETRHNLAVLQSPAAAHVPTRFAGWQPSTAASQRPAESARTAVHWVSPDVFARCPGPAPESIAPRPPAAPSAPAPAQQSERSGAAWWGKTSGVFAPDPTLSTSVEPVDSGPVKLCQALMTPAPHSLSHHGPVRSPLALAYGAFDRFAQGEYVGPARLGHVPQYHLRVGDRLEFVYRLSRTKSATPYRLNVGDMIVVESMTDSSINRGGIDSGQGLVIQPDGTITLPMLGQIQAAGLTVEELRARLTAGLKRFVKDPQITVTPLRVNTKLEDLRAAVDSRYGAGGQSRRATVTPEGTVQLPAIGSVPAQGLSLDELKTEVDQRYAEVVQGIEVTPILTDRAPRYVFVVGEVRSPGRFALEGPTTVMQAIAMAGSWNVGANLRQVIVFRRTEQWHLIATRLNLQRPLLGRSTCPADEIWLRDSDLVVVPKSPLLQTDDLIDLIFTRGIYGVLPVGFGYELTRASTL